MNKFSFLLLGMLVLNFLFTACDKIETVPSKVNDQKENSKSRPLEIVETARTLCRGNRWAV